LCFCKAVFGFAGDAILEILPQEGVLNVVLPVACQRPFDTSFTDQDTSTMSKLETIEVQIRALPREEAEALQDWLSEYLEDQAELNPEFVQSIERGQADLRSGRVRKRTPKQE